MSNYRGKWHRCDTEKIRLRFDAEWLANEFERSQNETLEIDDLFEISADFNKMGLWSKENQCGRRISYDIWEFENEHQMTMFLLRWA